MKGSRREHCDIRSSILPFSSSWMKLLLCVERFGIYYILGLVGIVIVRDITFIMTGN